MLTVSVLCRPVSLQAGAFRLCGRVGRVLLLPLLEPPPSVALLAAVAVVTAAPQPVHVHFFRPLFSVTNDTPPSLPHSLTHSLTHEALVPLC